MVPLALSLMFVFGGDVSPTAPQRCAAEILSRDIWFEAAGETVTLPFRDLAREGLVFVTYQYRQEHGVVFSDGDDFITIDSSSYPNDGVGLNGFETTITIEFQPPIHWIAVDLPACDELRLFAGDVELLQTSSCLPDFVGAGSTVPIDKVVVYDGAACPCIDDLHFSRTPAASDCNGNGVADLLEISAPCFISPDCNQNLLPDECDIDGGASDDCDGSSIPDECEVAHWQLVSEQFSPFANPIVATLIFPALAPAASDVQLRITVSADLEEPIEFISWVKLDDYIAGELLLVEDGLHCAHPPQELLLNVPTDAFNALLEDDGTVEVRVKPSAAVGLEDCPASFVAVELSYFTYAEKDLNFNGIPDSCETLPGDFDTDGDVDFLDLLTLLDAWGDCVSGQPCPADLDLSGDVSFADLVMLISNWT